MKASAQHAIRIALLIAALPAHAFDLQEYNAKFGALDAQLAEGKLKQLSSPPAAAPANKPVLPTGKPKALVPAASEFAATLPNAETPANAAASSDGSIFTNDDLKDQYKKLSEGYTYVLSQCEGRFAQANATLRRNMRRDEKVGLAGGAAGLYATIATCPHCAAVGGGLAGLASAFQKTAASVGDDTETARAQLEGVSAKIQDNLKGYRELPDPISSTTSADFRDRLAKRKQQLDTLAADCAFYQTTFKKAADAGSTPADTTQK